MSGREAADSSALVRTWRTSFLTLRDVTHSHPVDPLSHVIPLLDDLVFSHTNSFITTATLHLPAHEATSDVVYLLNLAAGSRCGLDDVTVQAVSRIIYLIRNITRRNRLELSSSVLSQMIDSFGKLEKCLIETIVRKNLSSENCLAFKATIDCFETIRHLARVDPLKCSVSENVQLVQSLLEIVTYCHLRLDCTSRSSGDDVRCSESSGNRVPQWTSLWKLETTAFSMIGEAFVRVGSSLPVQTWKSVVEVFRKVMDKLATKKFLIEDAILSRFYGCLLHCLHLVLVNRKESLSDHVAAFTATLRVFLVYGLSNSSLLPFHSNRDLTPQNHGITSTSNKKDGGAYRPPHLRRTKTSSVEQRPPGTPQTSSDKDSSPVDFSSSDSDYSDGDTALKDTDSVRSYKVRVAAITCIQDLCEADPKAFIAQWTILLPTNDALHPRKYDATLMTCLLFDPFLKVRLTAASTVASMLGGPSSVALQVAEYREGTKLGSYTALSSNLGQILMQLHEGVLHLIQRERHTGLLTSMFKILMLLISSTPYSRMPGELLPRVLSSLRLTVEEGFSFKSDHLSLQATVLNCLTAAVSTSPSSVQVSKMFQSEISAGKGPSSVLYTLFHYAEQVTNPTISFEALQALKAVCHNYPNVMASCWNPISSTVFQILKRDTSRVPLGRGTSVHDGGSTFEKVIAAAVKVVDECLRAISGFKGTEDLFSDNSVDTPFASDSLRDKKISSAPSYSLEALSVSDDNLAGSSQWSEAIEKLLAMSLRHPSGMVRAASVTCFAGMTYSVFLSLNSQQQELILSSCINAAYDLVPSVRSAACRAIGVITCFPDILRSAEVLSKFVKIVDVSTRDQLVAVRITASWAMANICDSFGHCLSDSSLDLVSNFELLEALLECALRLTRDGDKIKSNAVRALGYLSRVIPFTNALSMSCSATYSESNNLSANCCDMESKTASFNSLRDAHTLERIVQAFLSCITTGNVKVQWNVCHALSNLFLNASLRNVQMDWAPSIYSILLLLLRDSSNFKIRIQAAAALAVPTITEYGSSFADIVQGIGHNLENIASDQNSTPNFKYRTALEKQLTASMLHLLGLCSNSIHEPLKDFLVKRAPFLEGWLKELCSSLENYTHQGDEHNLYQNQKRDLILKAIQSLIEVYESKNQSAAAQKLEKLLEKCV